MIRNAAEVINAMYVFFGADLLSRLVVVTISALVSELSTRNVEGNVYKEIWTVF